MKPDLQDVFVFGGLVLTAAGIAAIYWPAALIVAGVVLFVLGIWRARGTR